MNLVVVSPYIEELSGELELPRFRGQVRVLIVCCFLHAVVMILPDSEFAAEGSRSAAILALA